MAGQTPPCQWCGLPMRPVYVNKKPSGAMACAHCDVPHQAYMCKTCLIIGTRK